MAKTSFGSFHRKKSTPPKEYEEWKASPTPQNFDVLMTQVDPIVSSALTSFGGGDKTLKMRAKILAAEALHTYDPGKASLNTHVYNHLKRLQRYRAQRGSAVHVPENVRLDRNAIYKFEKEYVDKKGHEPTALEISDNLGLSARRVRNARGASESPVSRRLSEKGDLPGKGRDPYQIWVDYVYHDLDDTNRKIFEWTTGYGGAKRLPKKEIAKRLRISAPAVSMRITTIAKRLEEGAK
ncbi:MAG: sigma-70 domain-containing protein [Candidatus Thorarchaeota archaeon]|jgi:DNA-directed RNA polymerase specialized sigma subunit